MKSRTIWVSGLLAGVAIGAYFYNNQDKLEPQQKKLKKLVADLQSVAIEIKDKLVASGQEGLEQTKKKIESVKN
jgi:hypothetical protein